MPTYEFRCPAGHEFERFYRKISDAVAELPCPECGQPAARKVSGGAGLMFKGSGFYLTDYGKNAHRKPAPKPEGGGAPKESTGDSATSSGSGGSAPASGDSGSKASPGTSGGSSGGSSSGSES